MNRLALVHAGDLVARELREQLGRRRELWSDLRLFTTDEDEAGTLTELAGAASLVQRLETDSLEGVDVVFFGGPMSRNRPLLEGLAPGTVAVVLSPDAEPEDGEPIVAGVNLGRARRDVPLLSPHPAVVALAHLLHPLLAYQPRQASATLLEPASALGAAALDEVLEQSRAILAFDGEVPREVYGAQQAFNVLPNPTAPSWSIARHLRRVLESELPVAVQALRAGVFHSYGISLHLAFDDDPGLGGLRAALDEQPQIELVERPEVLGPIDAAARDELLVGTVEEAADGGYWLWAVMDNLTCGGAANAVRILEAISRQSVH